MNVKLYLLFLASSLPLAMAAQRACAADAGKIIFSSTRTGNSEIFAMNPDGSGQTDLTNTPGIDEYFPDWSTDGNTIIYSRSNGLWTMNPNGTNPTVFVDGNNPIYGAYRPNSSIVSYSRPNGDYDIYTTTLDGSTTTNIIHNKYGDYYGRWSPDGRKIVFYTFDEVGGSVLPNLFLANPDGSGQTRLTSGSGTNQNARWNPYGNQLVFQSSRDGHPQIYRMDADGTNQVRLTQNAFSDTSPVYSPDGTKIAFVSNRDGNNEIYVMNANGTGQTRLTNNAGDDSYPCWQVARAANVPLASISDSTVTEANSTVYASFTISLSSAPTASVVVNFNVYDGTAHVNTDYVVPATSSVTFAPGQTSKVIKIPIKGDTVSEATETFSVRITAVGAGIDDQLGVGTIIDDDPLPSLSINDVSLSEGDSGTKNAAFTVSLSAISGQDVSVKYATANGTAIAGSDYIPATGTLVIPAGQSQGTINVPVIGDTALEADETFYVNLSVPTAATLGDSQGQGTITNDDTLALVSFAPTTETTEGNDAVFTLNLSAASTKDITVDYTTNDGTAVSGSDYVSKSGTLTIPAGQTTATINVPTLDDNLVEPDETFTLKLSNIVNAQLDNTTSVATIHSNDFPDISISDVAMHEGKSGQRSMFFSVALSEPCPFTVSVSYATADNTAKAGSDYVTTQGTLNFAANQLSQAITVPIIGDTTIEPNEVFFVKLNNPVRGNILTPVGHGIIVDDDGTPQISIDDASVTEGNSGTKQLTFTISLSAPSTSDVTVDYVTADGTATAGSDYAATSGTATIPAGSLTTSVSVVINGDTNLEADETFSVALGNAQGATISRDQATGIILNDDTAASTPTRSQKNNA